MFRRLDWLLMSVRALALSAAGCVALTAVVALVLDLSLSRAVALAPVIVATAGGVGFLLVLWSKVIWESTRRRSDDET